ncbi:MAG: CHC2 zinc finger domain-containing protein [Xanthobacteraceae bacterium]
MSAAFDSWLARARARPIERIVERLGIKLRRVGKEAVGACPKCGAGDDRFAVNIEKQLWHCRVCGVGGDVIKLVEHLDGIDFVAACTNLNGEPPPPKPKASSGKWKLISEDIYKTADGTPYLRVRKCLDDNGDKQYPQSHWNGKQWVNGKPDGAKLPYRLPELLTASLATPIFFPEGEKDSDALAKLGFTATTVSEGAHAKWDPELTSWFKDRHVVVLADSDPPGRQHVHKVAAAINAVAASVKVLDLYPDRTDGSDVSEFLREDPAGVRLVKLVKEAPLWDPSQAVAAPHVPEEDVDTSSGTATPEIILRKQADALIALAKVANLFHTAAGEAYADIPVMGHRETYRVRSKAFRSWLAHGFYAEREGAPSSEAMQSALGVIEARAWFDGPEIAVHVRVAGHEGKLYLDLADAKWQAIEIDADGWRVISSPPVRFRRAPGMLPLPEPVRGGSIKALRQLINLRDGDDGEKQFVLIVAWLLGALRDVGPYPVLVLSGESGVAKSMLCEVLQSLIDPHTTTLRTLPREDRDLFIAANNSRVLIYDNVSHLPAWLSDTLCRLATGGGFSTRALYSDDEEKLFDAMRPVILNGIEDFVTRADLSDRSMMLAFDPISAEKRRQRGDLLATFERERPRILGALLDAVAYGLAHLHHVRLDRLPRMAEFAVWIAACEPALWPAGSFLTAYETSREAAVGTTIEADLVASALRDFMGAHVTWTGTASDLLGALALYVPDAQRRSKHWPTLPHFLSGRLRRAAPIMRDIGITITFEREPGGTRTRVIRITKHQAESKGKSASEASERPKAHDINGLDRTLTTKLASDEASGNLASHAADAPSDAGGQASVQRKPLRIKEIGRSDTRDAHLPTLSGSPEDRTCVQCGGQPDGQEEFDAAAGVWLHRECRRFYLNDLEEKKGLSW